MSEGTDTFRQRCSDQMSKTAVQRLTGTPQCHKRGFGLHTRSDCNEPSSIYTDSATGCFSIRYRTILAGPVNLVSGCRPQGTVELFEGLRYKSLAFCVEGFEDIVWNMILQLA
jgi:hypothetical protein